MVRQVINVGTSTNDGTGDTLRVGAQKINDNFVELYQQAGQIPVASSTRLGGIKVGDNLLIDAFGTLSANPGGYTLPPATTTVLGGVKVDGSTISIDGSGVISANVFSGNYNDLTNKPSIPTDISDLTDNTNLLGSNGSSFDQNLNTTDTVSFSRVTSPYFASISDTIIWTGIGATNKKWTFGTDGSVTFPDSSVQTTAYTGGTSYDQSLNTTDSVTFSTITSNDIRYTGAIRTAGTTPAIVDGGATSVIYTFNNWITSVKLVIQAEGRIDGDVDNVDHTQTCEATIAATYNTTAEPIMSVYGIVYTSVAPLATFTIRRTGGTIEVLAQNSQATNNLLVKVQALQFVSRYD